MINFKQYEFFEACSKDSEIRDFLMSSGFQYKDILMADKTSATVYSANGDLHIFMSFGCAGDQGMILMRIIEFKSNPYKVIKLIEFFHNYLENENDGDAVVMALKLIKQKFPFPLYG